MSSPPLVRFPFEPLLEALGPVYLPQQLRNSATRRAEDFPDHIEWRRVPGAPCTMLSELTGISVRRWSRWAQIGVPVKEADRVAIAIGLHPALVWPEWFDQESA